MVRRHLRWNFPKYWTWFEEPINANRFCLSLDRSSSLLILEGTAVLLCIHTQCLNSQMSFQPAQSGQNLQHTPSSYQFLGSNDDTCNKYSTWTVLCEDLSDKPWREQENRYCKVKPEMKEKFRCLAIRALKNHQNDGHYSLKNVRIWERIELNGKC